MSISTSRSKKSPRSKSVTRSKVKKETYYYSVENVQYHVVTKDDKHYTNKLLAHLYLNRNMNGKSVGYYTVLQTHTIKKNNNNVHAEAIIITPNGSLMGTADWITDVDKVFLDPKKQKIVHFDGESSTDYYKSPQIVLTALDDKNRKLTVTYK